MADTAKLEILKELALRAHKGTSGRLPLKLVGEDVSLDGRFFIELKEANASVVEQLRYTLSPTRIVDGKIERNFYWAELLHKLVELNLIIDCNLFEADAESDDGIKDLPYPKESGSKRYKFLELFPAAICGCLGVMVDRFYGLSGMNEFYSELDEEIAEEDALTIDAVIDELGNSPDSPE